MDTIELEPLNKRVIVARNRVEIDDQEVIAGIKLPERDTRRARNRAMYLLELGLHQAQSRGLLDKDAPQRQELIREFLGAARRIGAEITEMGLQSATEARESGEEIESVRTLVDLLTGELTAPGQPFPDAPTADLRQSLGMSESKRRQVEYDVLASTRQLLRRARRGVAEAGSLSTMSNLLRGLEFSPTHNESLRKASEALATAARNQSG